MHICMGEKSTGVIFVQDFEEAVISNSGELWNHYSEAASAVGRVELDSVGNYS